MQMKYLEKQSSSLEIEREFHDEWARSIEPREVMVSETFTASTSPESRWLFEQMGDLRGKRLLDLGSGAGEAAVFFALQGAEVVATDISPEMLKVVEQVAEGHGTQLETKVCSAEDLADFEDDSFDAVFGANLLHHIEIESCLKEVKRVLKPGGIAAFWDPVQYNPVINVYRRMAAKVRTPDEHPIRIRDIKTFKRHFISVRKRFFWFFTLLVFLKFYLIDRIHPSNDRYWKRVLTHEKEIAWLYRPLANLDTVVLRLIPILGWWSWNVAVIARK
jgi:SAM-dependent methyltransferase